MTAVALKDEAHVYLVDALEPGATLRADAASAALGEVLQLDPEGLVAYFFAKWDPALVDLLLVAAVAEFCDVTQRRPLQSWGRCFDVRVAVHDPILWNAPALRSSLEETLGYLTGDVWRFEFVRRLHAVQRPQATLEFPSGARTIMPYSDGLDSRAVHALIAAEEGLSGLVRVRLGSGGVDQPRRRGKRSAFAVVPYRVRVPLRLESSARSRGFKFAAVTGIAASLAEVDRIIVTESGQGAFGPMLAVSGQTYPDYRVHPTFTRKMEILIAHLTGKVVRYDYPRLWSTKGETLCAAASLAVPPSWADTRSCWQQSRQASVDHRRRQCGVCAACMLRRMSMFTAGIDEPADTYVWERLDAPRFQEGTADGFVHVTKAMHDYAVAGVLHLEDLADLARSPIHDRLLRRAARDVAEALREDAVSVEAKLRSMLARHEQEWRAFRRSLGERSFVSQLVSIGI